MSIRLADELKSMTLHEDEIFTYHWCCLSSLTRLCLRLWITDYRVTPPKRMRLEIEDIMTLLDFVLNTTYFTFSNIVFQQKFYKVMGSPMSPIVANLFMEHLEQVAIATAPINYRPRMWKRYVDDILDVIKTGMTQHMTDHINRVDETNSIKFTHEGEAQGTMPFLTLYW